MNYKIVDNTMLLSLKRDEYINQSIVSVFEKEKLKFGWVNGIGAIYNIEIGCYDLKTKSYIKKRIRGDHELISMMGNITFLDNKHFIHTHLTVSDEEFKTFGGHLFDAQISATGEFKIDIVDFKIDRKFSDEIGLNLWCLKNESH